MLYPFISVGLVLAFFVYILYVFLGKKDIKSHKNNLLVGLFFIVIWAFIYFFILL